MNRGDGEMSDANFEKILEKVKAECYVELSKLNQIKMAKEYQNKVRMILNCLGLEELVKLSNTIDDALELERKRVMDKIKGEIFDCVSEKIMEMVMES
jgi:hypothetical protein